MQNLKITIIQTSLYWENINKNLELFSKKISNIKGSTDLIVLPEMFTTGFSMNTTTLAEKMNGKTMEWMAKTAGKKKSVIMGSIIVKEKNDFYNRLIWMPPSGKYKTYDKKHLFRMANEDEFYTEGKERLILGLKGWRICPLICYDLRFPVWSRNRYPLTVYKSEVADENYDLLIYIANWPNKRNLAWKSLLPARAIENISYVAGVNRIGKDGKGNKYTGDSGVYNFKGEKMSKTPANQSGVETISLSLKKLERFRKECPFWIDGDDFRFITKKE